MFGCGCFLLGDEVWQRYGLRTPIYIDFRQGLYLHPELLWKLGQLLSRKIETLEAPGAPKVVIGVPYTAVPLALAACLVAWREKPNRPLRFGLVRKQPSRFPDGRELYANIPQISGADYVLLDDVIASGRSKLEALATLDRDGFRIRHVLCVVDRQQGGAERLKSRQLAVHSLFQIHDVLDFYLREGLLTEELHHRICQHLFTHRFQETPQTGAR